MSLPVNPSVNPSVETKDERVYDLVVFGATSFVGELVCRYLVERDSLEGEPPLRWAMAGRSYEKLTATRARLGEGAQALPLLVADAMDEVALNALCAQTRVVLSTVGPYALYGEPLIKACVETGVDYCDLTGEVQWMRAMLERYEEDAKASGARLVHCCGFDSIPSDMGVFFLQREAERRFETPCERVTYRLKAARGGFSGGTVASLLNVAEELKRTPELRRVLSDPYALCVGLEPPKCRQPNVLSATYDKDHSAWLAPFIMASINTRIVHRAHALRGAPYGAQFTYDEATLTGRGLKGRLSAHLMSAGLGAFMLLVSLAPTRSLLTRFVLPKPGEGPSPEAQASGFFDVRLTGHTPAGERLQVKVTGDRDPGYGSTAKMIAESALALAFDHPSTGDNGGFWTPSTLLGEALLTRLTQRAGLTFEVLPPA